VRLFCNKKENKKSNTDINGFGFETHGYHFLCIIKKEYFMYIKKEINAVNIDISCHDHW
jgi:hypothetical protein